MTTTAISEAIKAAAEKEGLTVEQFRRKKKLPNTSFYGLLRGELPAKVSTREEWKKRLEAAGVRIPKDILAA